MFFARNVWKESWMITANTDCLYKGLWNLGTIVGRISLCNLQSINFSGPERTKHVPCWGILGMTSFHVGSCAKLHTFSLWSKTKGWVWFRVVGQVPCTPKNMSSQKEATFFQPPSFHGRLCECNLLQGHCNIRSVDSWLCFLHDHRNP